MRRVLAAAGLVIALTLTAGCAVLIPESTSTPQSPTSGDGGGGVVDGAGLATIEDAILRDVPDAMQALVEPDRDGLTAGLLVHVQVPDDYVWDGDWLKTALVAIWDSAEPKPAYVKFNLWAETDGKKGAFPVREEADELGIDWSPNLMVGINVPDYELKRLAGE